MNFTTAVEFLAATLVIVAAGAVLGAVLARRRPTVPAPAVSERLKTYADLLATIDGLRDADAAHKRRFIRAYQRTLVYAPDGVVKALDGFVQCAAADEFDPAAAMEARDAAVLSVRRDALAVAGRRTSIKAADLLSIEVDESRPATSNPTPTAPRPAADAAPAGSYEEPA